MSAIHFPFISHDISLRDLFARRGLAFGMAGEYTSFDSSVQAPLIKQHAATFSTEVSMKMEYTQPMRGVYAFDYADAMIAKCQEYGIDTHGHCVMWHMQYPAWMEEAMAEADEAGRYAILAEHVRRVTTHYAPLCESIDVVNEHQPAVEAQSGIFARYLGLEAGRFAFTEARKVSGDCKLFYNSFFRTDRDAEYAISLLDVSDGIGVQLHLNTWRDYTDLFARVRRMAEACKQNGKTMRFSEVSVQQLEGYSLDEVAEVYRRTVRLALEYPGVITNYTQWGVKGVAWNGGMLPFDSLGKPVEAIYSAMVEELNR
jgi:GH35 family endo-1,4-beta-xylanase